MGLTGAPLNPMRGALPFNSFLVRVRASNTYWSLEQTSAGEPSLARSSGSRRGAGKTGPCAEKKEEIGMI